MILIRRVLRHVARQPGPAEVAHQQLGHGVEAVGAPDQRTDLLAAGIAAVLRRHQQLPVPRQFAAIRIVLAGELMPGAAHRDHLDGAEALPFQRLRHAFVVEQQAEVGAILQQLARHVALGAAGQLHFQQGELVGQRLQAGKHRLVGHRLVLGQAQQCLLAAHQRAGAAFQAFALAQHFPRLVEQGAAFGGEHRLASTAALEEDDAEISFQHGDGRTHRRLHALELARGGGEGRLVGDADEEPQLFKVPLHDLSPLKIGNDFSPSPESLE
ncbi:hypothetical protein D3C76_1057690 [compost metagenome]